MCKIKYWEGGSPINKRIILKVKEVIDFLGDKKILIGIGIGLILGTMAMTGVKINASLSQAQIEEKARAMGMDYPENIKVIYDKEVKK